MVDLIFRFDFFIWSDRGRRGRGGRSGADGGGVGGGRGGFSSNDSFGRISDWRPQSGISFEGTGAPGQNPNDIVFQVSFSILLLRLIVINFII